MVYSVTYNASFLIPELILSAIVIVYLLGRTGDARGDQRGADQSDAVDCLVACVRLGVAKTAKCYDGDE